MYFHSILFATGKHPHLQKDSDSDELPDLDESPRASVRKLYHTESPKNRSYTNR